MNFDFKNDRSWFIIIILIVFTGPIGFVALFAKIAYMIYKSSQTSDELPKYETYTRTSKSSEYSSTTYSTSVESSATDPISTYEEGLNAHGTTPVSDASDTYDATGSQSSFYQSAEAIDVVVSDPLTEKGPDIYASMVQVDVAMDASVTESVGQIEVSDINIDFELPEVTTDISIDNPEPEKATGEPLKVLTCTMCGTENKIYEINVFETPSCEKCGMLLIDRS